MKILHTADWHLGHRLCEQDRFTEHEIFLDWLLGTIEDQQVDALIVAGDIFDIGNPPHPVVEQYYQFLLRVRQTCCKHIIIVGGNHDSPGMLNAPKDLLKYLDIHVVGKMPDDLREQIIKVPNRSGGIGAVVCAVPFLRQRDIYQVMSGDGNMEIERRLKEGIIKYYQQTAEYVIDCKREGIPVIATGHLFAAGSSASDSEKEIHVGNLGKVSGDQFPDIFDYVALGHIHRPQKINNTNHIRYSGSPIPLSFSENIDQKVVLVLEFKGSLLVSINELRAPVSRRLLRFRGSFESVQEQLLLVDDAGDKLPVWAEVRIETEKFEPYLAQKVKDIVKGRNIEILKTNTLRVQEYRSLDQLPGNQQSLDELQPMEVFLKKCESEGFDLEQNPEILSAFRELLAEIEEN